MDNPLILTHDHDPRVIFKPLFPSMDSPSSPPSPVSYDALWSSFQRLTHSYNDLILQHRELSEANRTLREECNSFRDNYWSLRSKHQEVVDEAINARIESWRHVVRLEELQTELRLAKQRDSKPISSKRKFTDIGCDDQDGGCSDWSASSSAHSLTFSTDAFNTPASASSKPASAPIINVASDDGYVSCRLGELSTVSQTPKRRRKSRSVIGGNGHECTHPHQHDALHTPNGTSSEKCPKDILTELQTGHSASRLQKTPQTRTKRSPKRRHLPLEDQKTTAAAVAAALSGAAASNTPHSSSRSLPDQTS